MCFVFQSRVSTDENGGKISIFFLEASPCFGQIFVLRTFPRGQLSADSKSVEIRFLTNQRVYFFRASCFLNGRNCNQAEVKRCE